MATIIIQPKVLASTSPDVYDDLKIETVVNADNATNDSDGDPINTTYTKDADFNNSSATEFGDYIISKKVELYKNATGTASVTGLTIASTDILEIHINGTSLSQKIYFANGTGTIRDNIISVSPLYALLLIGGTQITVISTSVSIGNTTYNRYKTTEESPTEGAFFKYYDDGANAGNVITAIYKIIQ